MTAAAPAVAWPGAALHELRCPACGGELAEEARSAQAGLACRQCGEWYELRGGIPRLLVPAMREALLSRPAQGIDERQVATAHSFGYEWSEFSEMYEEWESAFRDYMAPHPLSFLEGKRVLDAGCGGGRYAFHAARHGARVWGIDLGPAVEVAQRNAGPAGVRVVQGDLHHLPFVPESFDLVYSLGVLHHLPDPEGAFRNLLRYVRPGGQIHIYLYWKPEGQPLKRAALALVSALRAVSTRLPLPAVHALSYPAAWVAYATLVLPYRLASRVPGLRGWAETLPMKQYARYPFRVCLNDQFDRFSAPIENRYTRAEARAWLERADLEDITVVPNFGWVASGRKPAGGAR